MRCANCQTDNREGRKFCAQCGTALTLRCGSCGAPNRPDEKFCGDCGAALAAAPTSASISPTTTSTEPLVRSGHVRVGQDQSDQSPVPDGERKTVTALFADIKGSMALIEDLDPEEARAIVDPALTLMIDAVRHADGYVVQSTGDGVFAL